jgi:uncharacterized membrane protein YuzA (DUF378 family)
MTERVDSDVTSAPLSRVFALSGGILALFALNLFVLQPLIATGIGPRAAQMIYILIRVAGMIGLAYGLAKNAKRNRFQTVSTVLLVGAIDQVLLKGLWIKRDMGIHPADWAGFEPVNSVIFLNMAMGYLFFIPIILILAFVGMESTRFRRDWKA